MRRPFFRGMVAYCKNWRGDVKENGGPISTISIREGRIEERVDIPPDLDFLVVLGERATSEFVFWLLSVLYDSIEIMQRTFGEFLVVVFQVDARLEILVED